MLYSFIKIIARLALPFYCSSIYINKKDLLKMKGPLLLAANHPNSFLDAIILCTLFDRPVYSLARGDSFKNKLIAKLLYALKILPVYRVSEGVENLEENYKTFDACKEIFKKNGIVLIFSEGRCINEWHLRPLKKGTARLAISSWEEGIDLKVLPVGLNYSSFKKFGKNVKLFFGELITQNTNGFNNSHGKSIKAFNENLESRLKPFVFEIASDDKQKLKQEFYIAPSFLKKMVLFIPALIGLLVHAPIHYGIIFLNKKMVKEAGHFDSVMTGMWFFCYPVFLLLITTIIYFVTHSLFSLLLLIVLPFTAWAFVQLKQQLD